MHDKWLLGAYAAVALNGALAAHDGGLAVIKTLAPPPIEGIGTAPEYVQAGTSVLVRWEIIKRTDCPGKNARVWQGADGFIYRQALGQTRLPQTDDWRVYTIQTDIPDDAPPGELRLTIEGHYTCPGTQPEPFTLGPVTMTVTE